MPEKRESQGEVGEKPVAAAKLTLLTNITKESHYLFILIFFFHRSFSLCDYFNCPILKR